jgi:hypothetical protein
MAAPVRHRHNKPKSPCRSNPGKGHLEGWKCDDYPQADQPPQGPSRQGAPLDGQEETPNDPRKGHKWAVRLIRTLCLHFDKLRLSAVLAGNL